MLRIMFIVYMLFLAIMDIKWKKLNLAVLVSGFIFVTAGFLCKRDIHVLLLVSGSCVGIIFIIISKVTEESLGYGDSILILIIGGFLGFWNILSLLVIAFSMAALFSAFLMVKKKFRRKSSFPFVPFLTAAYIGGMVIGLY